ncbi:MAG: hypothetical protein ACI4EG_05880 [Fusicatenibacter sp.]
MKKYLSIIFAVLVLANVLIGCTGQSSGSEENMVSNTDAFTSTPKTEDMPDESFSKEDYQKLLALQFDDYLHMTVSEFQSKVWKMIDTPEYLDLLERFSKDETLYQMKDSNETASFLFYVLEPLTAENWQKRDYSGDASSDFPFPAENAVLEYTYMLTILDADKVLVKDYNDTRLGVKDALNDILCNRTKEELQNETLMLTELKTYIDEMLSYMQTPELNVTIEYVYHPLLLMEGEQQSVGSGDINTQETRRYSNGTEEDYRSLLALKTPDYQNRSLADFNMTLLEWANEDNNRIERIGEDVAWDDFKVNLTSEERSFVKFTVFLSYTENGTYIRKEENPSFAKDMPQRTIWKNGYAAWCSLYYQFSYHISDKNAVTVGERDQQIEKMISAIQMFWDNTDIEYLLKMNERDVVEELEKLAALCSNDGVTITIDEEQVQFECMDERGYGN